MSFQENIHLKIKERDVYFLPDVIVTCNEQDLDLEEKTVQNPMLVVEVLSESTEINDRNRKWENYRQIRCLRYYMLISEESYRVELFSRQSSTSIFSYQVFSGLEDVIYFPNWEIKLKLSEIYEDVILPH